MATDKKLVMSNGVFCRKTFTTYVIILHFQGVGRPLRLQFDPLWPFGTFTAFLALFVQSYLSNFGLCHHNSRFYDGSDCFR